MHDLITLLLVTSYFLVFLYPDPVVCPVELVTDSVANPLLSVIVVFRILQLTARFFSGLEKDINFTEKSSSFEFSSSSLQARTAPVKASSPKFLIKIGGFLGRYVRYFSDRILFTSLLILTVVIGSISFLVDLRHTLMVKDLSKCLASPILPSALNFICVITYLILISLLRITRDAYGIYLELLVHGLLWIMNIIVSHVFRLIGVGVILRILPNLFYQISLHWITIGVPLTETLITNQRKTSKTLSYSIVAMGRSVSLQADWYSFERCLQDPELLIELNKFAITEFSVENIHFIRRLRLLRKLHSEGYPIIPEMNSMYTEFFETNAPNELNVVDEVKEAIKQAIQLRAEDVSLFDQAEREIQRLVFNHTFPRFLQSRAHH